MSNFETFGRATQGDAGTAPNLWLASTADSLGTITATGYLNDKSKQIKANDVIFVNYSDTSTFPLNTGESSTYTAFKVTYSASNWSMVAIPDSQSLTTSVTMTAAEFNGMYAAPKLLISAPGANKVIIVDAMEVIMTYVSANYAAGGVVAAQYDSTVHGAGVLATNTEAAADFQAAASTTFRFAESLAVAPFSTTVNKGVYLSNATAAFTTGDSTFKINLTYRIVSVV